jgi:hypothetical protein
MGFKRSLLLIATGVYALLAVLLPASHAFADALPSDDIDSIYNDTVWYKPGATQISSSSDCSTGVISVAGGLPNDVVSSINKLQSVYQQAAQATGVPWQLLAAVHYREAGNSPNQDLQAGNPIGGPYNAFSGDYTTYGHPKTLEESAEIAAKHLIASANGGIVNKPINVDAPDPEAIKDVLFSYNGRAEAYAQQAATLGFDPKTQPYEGSPYVMNNFDQVHRNMKIITHDFGGLDGVDTRFGAFTIYSKLGGASGGDNCPGAVSGNLMQTILNYAWPDYHPPVYVNEKPAYKNAILAAKSKGIFTGGDYDSEHVGIDCGGFVTRVMQDSGVDPTYNENNGGTIMQQAYLDAHPEKYQKLSNVSGTDDLQPGDIAVNDTHTYIFVGSLPGFNGNSASASWSSTGLSWRAPMASTAYGFGGEYSWYRLKTGANNG